MNPFRRELFDNGLNLAIVRGACLGYRVGVLAYLGRAPEPYKKVAVSILLAMTVSDYKYV